MKNKELWHPTKYVYKDRKLIASRDSNEVTTSSRLTADITANLYDKYLPIYAKGKLLDLGCGKVPLYETYKGLVTENICIDWSNSIHNNIYLDIECDLSEALPLENEEFDTIILSDVLEHIFNPENLWAEMNRVTAPEGTLIINVPFFYWLHEQPHDYYRYTGFALKKFADNAGFKVLHIETTGGSPEVFVEFITKHLQHVPLIGVGLSSALQLVTKLFLSSRLGQRVSARTGEVFPLGYFLVLKKQHKINSTTMD